MGQRNVFQTLARVLAAFRSQRTWRQKELADHVGVGVAALRKALRELEDNGVPLEQESDPPQVYWSVPSGWVPEGAVFSEKDLADLLDAIFRVPDAARRERLMRRVTAAFQLPKREPRAEAEAARSPGPLRVEEHAADSVVAHLGAAPEQPYVALVEESVMQRRALQMRYFSAHRGDETLRVISPHRVFLEPRPRVVAVCHLSGELRWFRIDSIGWARPAEQESFLDVQQKQLDEYVAESVDAFHDGAPLELAFNVRYPESVWVRRNLLPQMHVDEKNSSKELTRITCRGAVAIVARFVAGLGGAAVCETPELAMAVREIASGTLAAHPGTKKVSGLDTLDVVGKRA